MPVYEYKCMKCDSKFEVLHKTVNVIEDVVCPSCMSKESKKLFSKFKASVPGGASASFDGCADGSCGIDSGSSHSCASGSCCCN